MADQQLSENGPQSDAAVAIAASIAAIASRLDQMGTPGNRRAVGALIALSRAAPRSWGDVTQSTGQVHLIGGSAMADAECGGDFGGGAVPRSHAQSARI